MQVPSPKPAAMGVWAATAVVTGEAISLGIFLTPAGMARSLGSPALLAAVWCGMAALTLAGALCFTELAVRYPHDGGEYVYLRRGFGRRVCLPLWMDGRHRHVSRGSSGSLRRHRPLHPGHRSRPASPCRSPPRSHPGRSRRAQLLRHPPLQRRNDHTQLAQGSRARRARRMGVSCPATPPSPTSPRSPHAAPAPTP